MVSPFGAEYVLQPVAVDVRRVAAVAVCQGEGALVGLLEVSVGVVDVEARQRGVAAEEDVGLRIVVEVGDDSPIGLRGLGDAGVCGLVNGAYRYPAGGRCPRCARAGGLGRRRTRLFCGLGRGASRSATPLLLRSCCSDRTARRADGLHVPDDATETQPTPRAADSPRLRSAGRLRDIEHRALLRAVLGDSTRDGAPSGAIPMLRRGYIMV